MEQQMIFENKAKLPAGTYFIGDPSYPMIIDPFGWMFSTAHGDGTFCDQFGNEYSVDTALLGVVLVDPDFKDDLGQTVTFEKEFDVECDNGVFIIGDIVIDTNK